MSAPIPGCPGPPCACRARPDYELADGLHPHWIFGTDAHGWRWGVESAPAGFSSPWRVGITHPGISGPPLVLGAFLLFEQAKQYIITHIHRQETTIMALDKPFTFDPMEIWPTQGWEIYDPNLARIVAVFYNQDEAEDYLRRVNKRQAKKKAKQQLRAASVVDARMRR